MQISGKTFLVTGGSSGLGEVTARMLAAGGANVVIADMNREQGEKVAAAIGGAARFAACDVTSEADVERAVAACRDQFGALHGAINCAGIVLGERVIGRNGAHRLDSFVRIVNVNLIGTFNVIRLAANAMAQNAPSPAGERGIIVNTASVAAFDGQIGQAGYSASKAGVVGMTLPIARELAKLGIRVMTIAPGIFDTAMVGGFTEELRHSLEGQVPFPSRLGRADEYASLVRHICENEMLNGEVIRLDGAIRMAPK